MGVQKYSPELAVMLCDRLTQNPSITHAARFFSLTEQTIFLWLRASARDQAADVPLDKSKWAVQWPRPQDGEDEPPMIFLHEAVILSQKLFRAIAESNLRALIADGEAGGGVTREVLDGSGRPVWETDPLIAAHALSMDEFDWEMTYGERRRDDVYKRDENGALIPKRVRDPLPSQTLIHLMRSLFGDTFNPSDRKEVDNHTTVETLIIDGRAKKPYSDMRADLERRLAEIRSAPDRASAKPTGPVAVIGRGTPNDPPERISASADDAPARLADNPRAYIATPTHVPAAPPIYARPNRSLDQHEQVGRGVPPAGGMKVR